MNDQPINPKTAQALKLYVANPGQSIGLIGQRWLNKGRIARNLAEDLLQIDRSSLDKYPYYLHSGKDDLPSISIDDIRAINSFLMLKVPINKTINRVVIIEGAERMTLEAQNALLKNLEEPPRATAFILTAESLTSLLPTITSRLNVINVYKPAKDEIVSYFMNQGYDETDVNQSLLISDGLPALMEQLLSSKDSSINDATALARKLLSSSTFERLSYINDLSKDKEGLKNTLFVIKQMAKIGVGSNESKSALRWQKVLSATLESETKLNANVQVKLLLTDYVLSLG